MPGRTELEPLPLRWQTPPEWAERILRYPLDLLADHAHLEHKAAVSAMYVMSHWPDREGIVERMAAIAREELEHLVLVHRILLARGGSLPHDHANPYVRGLQEHVRKGTDRHLLDRLLVSSLIEARSCERFERLADAAEDVELRDLYAGLCASERGHHKSFLNFATREYPADEALARWDEMLEIEAQLLAGLPFARRMHSGVQ